MPFERVKALWHTLRFRLMLWNAGAVILTVLATLFVVREGVRLCLLDELDRRLTEDLLEIALAIEEPHAPDFEQLVLDLDRKARGHLQHGWFVRLFHADGRELWASEHAVQLRVPTDAFGDFQPATLDTHRAMQHRVRQKDGRVLIVRVGASLGFLAADMALIDRLVADIEHGRFERSLAGLTAAAAVVTAVEIYLEHYRASFGNKWMWSPIIVTPPVVIAGAAGVVSRRWAKTALPLASVVFAATGLLGEYFHARGVARKPGGWRNAAYNVPTGPPISAPGLMCMVGGMGVLAAVLRREQ